MVISARTLIETGTAPALIILDTAATGGPVVPVVLAALGISREQRGIVVMGVPSPVPEFVASVQATLQAGAGGYLFESPPKPRTHVALVTDHQDQRGGDVSGEGSGSSESARHVTCGRSVVTVLDADAVPCTLTLREVEILQHVADGETTIRIGRCLKLSPHTIKSHLHRTGRRLGTTDRAHMILLAMRAGAVT